MYGGLERHHFLAILPYVLFLKCVNKSSLGDEASSTTDVHPKYTDTLSLYIQLLEDW